ncbi:hypothetical protein [Sphingomonas sp. BAUL-RG-20F-R05-02]|uniref:hypothetical protein n=1 Tax=Sphingomonas sp. BAUL-RG-20F-R05-02 TaxID=2914830 RepID=UPI001F585459|nr:hypothetical protein [Sphingomonas sp. BAUL-RG-20F-R05-02]
MSPLQGLIDPRESLHVTVLAPMTLSNKGGIISLIDAGGGKVDGVSYTGQSASQPGAH